jgi:hypothetical protein
VVENGSAPGSVVKPRTRIAPIEIRPSNDETLIGAKRIRDVLAGMIDAKTRLHSRAIKAVAVGDVALLLTDFEGTTVDDSGKTVAIRHKAIEFSAPSRTAPGN